MHTVGVEVGVVLRVVYVEYTRSYEVEDTCTSYEEEDTCLSAGELV